jgi:hypothetical protein
MRWSFNIWLARAPDARNNANPKPQAKAFKAKMMTSGLFIRDNSGWVQ